MDSENKTLEELFAIMTAGGRLRGEQSRALPQRSYQDPSQVVEFERAKKIKRVKTKKRNKQYR